MTTLANRLEQWRSDDLKKYVYLLGGNSSIIRKADRVAFICQKMLVKDSLHMLWHGLDGIARRAVSTAYHNDG